MSCNVELIQHFIFKLDLCTFRSNRVIIKVLHKVECPLNDQQLSLYQNIISLAPQYFAVYRFASRYDKFPFFATVRGQWRNFCCGNTDRYRYSLVMDDINPNVTVLNNKLPTSTHKAIRLLHHEIRNSDNLLIVIK